MFGPNCMIKMSDGTFKLAENIKHGDKLWGEEESTVICVVTFLYSTYYIIPVDYGVILTSYHPFYHNNRNCWVFPVEDYLKFGYTETRNLVYDFVLDKN